MPPKGSTKPKAAEPAARKTKAPETPASKAKAQEPSSHKSPSKPKSSTPKKPKPPPVTLSSLPSEDLAPVSVTFEGTSLQAKLGSNGNYSQVLHLTSSRAFAIFKSTYLTSGELNGMQSILLRPAAPFPFTKLEPEIRSRIYTFYFAPLGIVGAVIPIEGKRITSDSKDLYAKSYADGNPNRVALLAVNKEIHEQSIQVLYGHQLRFDTTSTLSEFVAQLPPAVRPRLMNLSVHQWVKTTSRNAMMMLSEAMNMRSLLIENGLFNENDPLKAAKSFWSEAYKFLEAVGAARGNKVTAVDVLMFGPKALCLKKRTDKKDAQAWDEEQVEEFKQALREKLLTSP